MVGLLLTTHGTEGSWGKIENVLTIARRIEALPAMKILKVELKPRMLEKRHATL